MTLKPYIARSDGMSPLVIEALDIYDAREIAKRYRKQMNEPETYFQIIPAIMVRREHLTNTGNWPAPEKTEEESNGRAESKYRPSTSMY